MNPAFQPARRLDGLYFSPLRQMRGRMSALSAAGRPVISFAEDEPDFPLPEPIREAALRALREGRNRCAPSRGTRPLREATALRLRRTMGVDYDPEDEILITTGNMEALHDVFLAFLNPGDEVIVFTPALPHWENLIALCGGILVDVPLERSRGFPIDVEQTRRRVTSRTRMLLLSNPCNPTGAVCPEETLEQLAALAMEHNLLVLSDESYDAFVWDGVLCRSIASFPGMRERTIVLNSFSFSFALADWRLSFLAMTTELCSAVRKIHQYNTACAPSFLQDALAHTLNAPETLAATEAMVRTFDARRRLLMAGLRRMPELTWTVPTGTFCLLLDVSATGLDGDDFASRLLEEYQVACIPGSKLVGRCDRFVRISYAVDDAAIREGLERMERFRAL